MVDNYIGVYKFDMDVPDDDDKIRKLFADGSIHEALDDRIKFNNIDIRADDKRKQLASIFMILNGLCEIKLDPNKEYDFDNAVFEYHLYDGVDCRTPFANYADNDNGETNVSFVICLYNDMRNSGFIIGDELIDITPINNYTYMVLFIDGEVLRQPVVTTGKMETIELIVPFQLNMSR